MTTPPRLPRVGPVLGLLLMAAPLAAQQAPEPDRYQVRLAPDLATVAPGGTVTFAVELTFRGRPWPVESWDEFVFSAEEGLFRANVYFAPRRPGIYRVSVRHRLMPLGHEAAGFVRVNPALRPTPEDRAARPGPAPLDTPQGEALRLWPAELTLRPGNSVPFRVETVGGTPMPGRLFRWDAGTLGRIAEDGWFTAGEGPGEGLVTAQADDGRAAQARVRIVRYAPAAVEIQAPATVAPEKTLWLRAWGVDGLGGRRRLAARWFATAGRLEPRPDGSAEFTAPRRPGDVFLVAVDPDSGLRGVHRLEIARLAPLRLEVHPSVVSLAPGEQRQLFATGVGLQGEMEVREARWFATAGTVGDGGLFTAPGTADGPIFVIAWDPRSGLTAVAELRVEAQAPALPDVIPAPARTAEVAPPPVEPPPGATEGRGGPMSPVQPGEAGPPSAPPPAPSPDAPPAAAPPAAAPPAAAREGEPPGEPSPAPPAPDEEGAAAPATEE